MFQLSPSILKQHQENFGTLKCIVSSSTKLHLTITIEQPCLLLVVFENLRQPPCLALLCTTHKMLEHSFLRYKTNKFLWAFFKCCQLMKLVSTIKLHYLYTLIFDLIHSDNALINLYQILYLQCLNFIVCFCHLKISFLDIIFLPLIDEFKASNIG